MLSKLPPRSQAVLASGLCLLMLAYLLYAGLLGIDFGRYWDEGKLLWSVANTLQTGEFLPRWYNYPSMSYWLSMLAVIPEALSPPPGFWFEPGTFIQTEAFVLQVRQVFLAVSLLSVPWVFALIWRWRGKVWEALAGAAFLGGSWELMYHARWAAPDAIMMQFAALSMLLMVSAQTAKTSRWRTVWLRLAAISAGLCLGTKYPGGLMLVPLLLNVWLLRRRGGLAKTEYIWAALLFVLAFVVSTPGALMDTSNFTGDIRYEMEHYGKGHGGHSVEPFGQHAVLMTGYLSLEAFSKLTPLALVIFLFSLMGAYALLRRDPMVGLWFLSMPVLYFLYFSAQKVMLVGNLLVLLPFLSILAAHGLGFIYSGIRHKPFTLLLTATVLITALSNLGAIHQSAWRIKNRNHLNHAPHIMKFLQSHPGTGFVLSPRVQSLLPAEALANLPNLTAWDQADYVIFSSNETANYSGADKLPANVPGRYRLISGIEAVNPDYYPDWIGSESILAVSKKYKPLLKFHHD